MFEFRLQKRHHKKPEQRRLLMRRSRKNQILISESSGMFVLLAVSLQTHLIVPDQSFAFVAVVTLGGRVIVPGHEQREAEQRALTTNSEELRTVMEK
ncbi:hypothetical protein TNIN_124901 [Trichonephila inaurata madagascariensis]|uniref:Uncharacterized protein n=1 Tax=Trichonephila inaurata madagascariensis TaxID=2747483 RepID=A0A8X6J040_9ARAC|nr:hypothetical protein TNIN_124901 [Trichonephila inaurata madagascariensis]